VFAGWDRGPHTAAMQMHAGQLTISAEAVHELVSLQFPQWDGLPVRAIASHGTVNVIFRVGGGLAARFPLRAAEGAATRRWLEAKAAAARQLARGRRFGGSNRGGDLRPRDAWMEECFERSKGLLDVAWLRGTWQVQSNGWLRF
jgi:hypothetical protein